MARPSCSKNEPNTLGSKGAIVRRVSTKMRDWFDVVCAPRKGLSARFVDAATPATKVLFKKLLRSERNISTSLCRIATCVPEIKSGQENNRPPCLVSPENVYANVRKK